MPDGIDPQIAQFMQSSVTSFSAIKFPQPADPVGVGAEWTSSSEVESAGMTFTVDYRFRLVAIEDDIVTIEITFVQTPAPTVILQGIEFATLGNLTGSGTTRNRVGGVLPIENTVAASGSITMSSGGDEIAMNIELATSMVQDPAG
jgi:hypothetical protein